MREISQHWKDKATEWVITRIGMFCDNFIEIANKAGLSIFQVVGLFAVVDRWLDATTTLQHEG